MKPNENMITVKFHTPKQVTLLEYLLRSLLQRNANKQENIEAVQKMRCKILVKASEMKVTLVFKSGEIEIVQGGANDFNAYVEGSLGIFFQICLGKSYIVPLLTRKIRIGGNVFKLISLLKLLKV